MKKSILGAFPFLKPSTKANPQLHTAVLMSSVEVDVASKNYPVEASHKLRGQLMLVGAVNEEMYLMFKLHAGNDIAGQLKVPPTPAGAAYVVVTCQIGTYQHRFVLPLFDSKVVEFLASTANESINIYLESGGDLREGMLYNCLFATDELALARTMCMTIDYRQQDEFTYELPSLLSEMLSVNLMPSLNVERVLAVDVSVLLPRPQN